MIHMLFHPPPLLRALCTLLLLTTASAALAQATQDQAQKFRAVSRNSDWQLQSKTPLQFDSFHPQGMVKIGDAFFLSSVEVITETQRLAADSAESDDGHYDRTTGVGIGHLFKFDLDGQLLQQTTLGEGSIYHPGGIDFDGQYIWVSVSEYRPNSHSIIYRINPIDLSMEEVMRFDDHLGAVVNDPSNKMLHGVNWGSRDIYSWPAEADGFDEESVTKNRNGNQAIDYQDCQHLPDIYMLCSGLASHVIDNNHTLTIGGIDLVDLSSYQIAHQITIVETTVTGEILGRNPFFYESGNPQSATFYFVPEDEASNLYQYEVKVQP